MTLEERIKLIYGDYSKRELEEEELKFKSIANMVSILAFALMAVAAAIITTSMFNGSFMIGTSLAFFWVSHMLKVCSHEIGKLERKKRM